MGLSAHSKVYGRAGCYACFFGFIHECGRFHSATTGSTSRYLQYYNVSSGCTNSRLKAPAAAAVELQPVQQSPSKNRSFEVPAADQSKLIFQQTVRAPTFTELVVQASSCVEEIRHYLQQDGAIIPAMHAVKRYKMSSFAEKLFNQQTVATALMEADQAHGNLSKRSGKAVYWKQLQQLQTDHEEPNLELRLGNGHLHNVDVQGRTFLYSRPKELQLQRAAAAAYPISCHIPVEVPRLSPNEFRYRVESRGSVLQQVASPFSRPPVAAPPPIIGSTSTAMLPISSRTAVQEHPGLNHGTARLEVLKDGARAVALRSYRQQLIMTRSASSSEMPIVLPPVPGPYTTTESCNGPANHNCSPATTTISNATIIRHPASVIMGTMGPPPPPPPPPLMIMSSMGPPPLPEILGPTAAQAQPSVISIPFPQDRPLPSSPGRDVSLCKYIHFPLLELLQLFMSHAIPTAALGLCIPLSFHVVMIQAGMYVVMSFVLVSNM